jgi:hypothetical protein
MEDARKQMEQLAEVRARAVHELYQNHGANGLTESQATD